MRENRLYVSAISAKWLDLDPNLAQKHGQFSVTNLVTNLQHNPGDPPAVLFDKEAGSLFVSEAYIAARPELDVAKIAEPFQTAKAAKAHEACRPANLTIPARDLSTTVPMNDEMIVHVPAYEVAHGQVVLDESGRPMEISRLFGETVRREFGGIAEYKGHVYDREAEVMGTWTVRKSDYQMSLDGSGQDGGRFKEFIDKFLMPEAIENVQVARAFDRSAAAAGREGRAAFVDINTNHICTEEGRKRLEEGWIGMRQPIEFIRQHAALSDLKDRLATSLQAQEEALGRFVGKLDKTNPVRARKLHGGGPVFNEEENEQVKQMERDLHLTRPIPMQGDTKAAKDSRNPNNKGLRQLVRDVDVAMKVLEQTYAAKSFPISILEEAVRNYEVERTQRPMMRMGQMREASPLAALGR